MKINMKIISNPLKSFVWLISLTLGWGCIRQSVYSASSFKAPGVDGYQVESAELKGLNEKLGTLIDQFGYEMSQKWPIQSKFESTSEFKIKFEELKFEPLIEEINKKLQTDEQKKLLELTIELIETTNKNFKFLENDGLLLSNHNGLLVILKELLSQLNVILTTQLIDDKRSFLQSFFNVTKIIIAQDINTIVKTIFYFNLFFIKLNEILKHKYESESESQKDQKKTKTFIDLIMFLMNKIANSEIKYCSILVENFSNLMNAFEKILKNSKIEEKYIDVIISLMNKIKDLEPENLNKNLENLRQILILKDDLLWKNFEWETDEEKPTKQEELPEAVFESMANITKLKDDEQITKRLQEFYYSINFFYYIFQQSFTLVRLSYKRSKKRIYCNKYYFDKFIEFFKLTDPSDSTSLNSNTQSLIIFSKIIPIFRTLSFNKSIIEKDSNLSLSLTYYYSLLSLTFHYFFEYLDQTKGGENKKQFIDSVVGPIEDSFEFLGGIKEDENDGQLTDSFNPKTLDNIKEKLNLACNSMIDFYEKNIKTAVNGDMSDTQESETIQLKEALAIILEEKVQTDRILEIKKKERQEIALEEEKKKKERQIWEAQQKEHKRKIEEQNKLEGEAFNLKSKEESERLKEQLELDNNKRTVVSTENLEQQQLQPDQNLFSSSSSFSIPIATTLVVTGTVIVLAKSMASKPPQQSQPNPSQQNYPQTSMVQENYQFEYHNSVEAY
jgi:hypothetical protein